MLFTELRRPRMRLFWLILAVISLSLMGCAKPAAAPIIHLPTTSAQIAPSPTPLPSPIPVETIYYVAPDGRDDLGNGSVEFPWATINYAAASVPDGALILVKPGTYQGQVALQRQFDRGIIIRSERPYQAQLRHDRPIITCFVCQHVTIEGFDIAHTGPETQRYVIQIQDIENTGRGGQFITLRNNVLHDSYNNDILKINNGAQDIVVEGNIFYNQAGQDSHIDLTSVTNVTVQDNIFFNDFAGSGRTNEHDTGSFVVIKDANGEDDGIVGSHDITVRRNIFLNWEGEPGSAFIALGDNSSVNYFQAHQILIENNLMLGNAPDVIHAALKITGGQDIVFRSNTVVGDLPGQAYAVRLVAGHMPNEAIAFYNNIWADSTGTMGAAFPDENNDLADTTCTDQFVLLNNLYWNGRQAVPPENDEPFNVSADPQAMVVDPRLTANQSALVLPRWDARNGRFADGSRSIREAFIRLVSQYGTLPPDSPAIAAADPRYMPSDDILGHLRDNQPDMGAAEQAP